MKNKIIFVVLIILIFSSNLYASTDTMDTTFENMSLDTWLKVTDYLYDNIEDANIKAKLQPLTTNGSKSTAIYSSVMNTIDNYEELTSSSGILQFIRYARSELSSLIFIVTNDSRLHIFTNELWKFNGGTVTDFTNYEYVEPATFDMSISVSNYNGNGGNASFKYHGASSSTDVHTGNYYHLYIDLNSNYSISGSNGNYSNFGVTIPISKYNLVQEDDYNRASFSYGSEQDNTMIVQIAGSGSLGNPLISYYMPYYASNNSTVLPYLCSNAVYLDGSENTGGSTGGNTGPDTGGGNTGGSTGGGNVDLGQIEEELGNISGGINNPDSTLNNNLDDIENAINNNTDYISKDPVYDENGNLAEEQPGMIGKLLQGFWNILVKFFDWLMVPDEEQISDVVDDVLENDLISESVLGLPLQLISRFLNLFENRTYTDWVIEWDDINFKFSEKDGSEVDMKMFSAYSFNISEFVRNDETLSKIYSYYIILVNFGAVCGLIYWGAGLVKGLLGIEDSMPGANDETDSPDVTSMPDNPARRTSEKPVEKDYEALERYMENQYGKNWEYNPPLRNKSAYKAYGRYKSIYSDMKAGRYKKK